MKTASAAALDRHTELARLAVEETGRGAFEDKAAKNMFACEPRMPMLDDMQEIMRAAYYGTAGPAGN